MPLGLRKSHFAMLLTFVQVTAGTFLLLLSFALDLAVVAHQSSLATSFTSAISALVFRDVARARRGSIWAPLAWCAAGLAVLLFLLACFDLLSLGLRDPRAVWVYWSRRLL